MGEFRVAVSECFVACDVCLGTGVAAPRSPGWAEAPRDYLSLVTWASRGRAEIAAAEQLALEFARRVSAWGCWFAVSGRVAWQPGTAVAGDNEVIRLADRGRDESERFRILSNGTLEERLSFNFESWGPCVGPPRDLWATVGPLLDLAEYGLRVRHFSGDVVVALALPNGG